jgi:rubrerythrin
MEISALLAAAKIEEWGKEFYRRIADCVADDASRILLSSLARNEAEHQAELEAQIARLAEGVDLSQVTPDDRYMDIIPTAVFPFPPQGACLNLKDEVRVMEEAVLIETRKGEMFKDIAERATDCRLQAAMSKLYELNRVQKDALNEDLFYLRRGGAWYGYLPLLDG